MSTSVASKSVDASGQITEVRILRGGVWESSSSARWSDVFNPSSGKVIARVPLCTAAGTARVVETTAEALPAWAATPAVERCRLMFKFRELMLRDFEKLAALVSREHGKTPVEARASVQRGIEVVEFACGVPIMLMGRDAAESGTGMWMRSRFGIRWACAWGSRRLISPRWFRCGCFPSPWRAEIRLC